jgi:very-short-patch-repair endonuclease
VRGLRISEVRRARGLRREQTEAERRLWRKLRDRRLGGFKFVRQEPIGPFVADFVCRERALILEVDGATHSTDKEVASDAWRTAFLEREGYRVLRATNAEVYENLDGVLETILAALSASGTFVSCPQPITPALSPQAGKGGR